MGTMDDGVGGGIDEEDGDGDGEGLPGGDGLFHDAQDVPMPTLSVYDPERLWEYVERPLMVYMPLRKLSAKVRGEHLLCSCFVLVPPRCCVQDCTYHWCCREVGC